MSKHLIFDLDGTLVDSAPMCVAILNAMLAERGCDRKVCPIEIKPFLSLGGEQMVKALLGAECGDPQAEIADFRRRYEITQTPETSLYADVRAGLSKLRELGYHLSICSNKPQNLCHKVLTELSIDHYFDLVICGGPTRRAKPEPDMLAAVLSHHNADAETCLYIGDSEVDHATAHALNMPFLLVTYGYGAPELERIAPRKAATFAQAVCMIMSEGIERDRPEHARARTAIAAVA